MTQFTGYPDGALNLLTRIGAGDRDFFAANKDAYTQEILEPTRALVVGLAPILHQGVSEDLQVVDRVNGSISPITNDLRFHSGPPYKDYVLLRFWEGTDKAHSPMLFLRLGADGVGFGAGRRFAGSDLDGYRQAVARPAGAQLADLVAGLVSATGGEVIGPELKRVPAPFASDHPRADLLRRKELGVRWLEPVPRSLTSARFVPWCGRRLERAAGLYRWLRDEV